jgi:uncharacterized protein (PEP-CTERM system associated)
LALPLRARVIGVKSRSSRAAFAAAATIAVASPPTHGQTWKYEPSIAIDETVTNNVNLDPNSSRRGDFVTTITPGLRFSELGAHTSLTGSISLPVLLYARTGSDNNDIVPQVNVLGNAELLPRLFYLEGSAYVSQQYLTPFGARPSSLTTRTDNQYTSQVYRLTPYIKGEASGDLNYELRDINTWTKGDATSVNNTFSNEVLGTLRRDPRPFGWGADYDRVDTKFGGQQSFVTELGRLRGSYLADQQLELTASIGYEHNDFLIVNHDNSIYGVGMRWRPTERTTLDASWEHRFFGASYNVVFNHRTALSTWNAYASRNITSYPQQFGALGSGVDVAAALNQIFAARITDPAQRQTIVNQFINDRGLPSVLSGPINVFTEQITLQESMGGAVTLSGARNTASFSAYRQRNEPITGAGTSLPDPFNVLDNNTQYGGNAVWSTALTPRVALTTSIEALRTVANAQPGTTKQLTIRTMLTTPLSDLTSFYAGLRYQVLHSTLMDEYDEVAAFVGIVHIFH